MKSRAISLATSFFLLGEALMTKFIKREVAQFEIESGFFFTGEKAVCIRVNQALAYIVQNAPTRREKEDAERATFSVEHRPHERSYLVTFNEGTTIEQVKSYAKSLAMILVGYYYLETEFQTSGPISVGSEIIRTTDYYIARFGVACSR